MNFWTKPVRWQSVVVSALAAFIASNVALAASWTTVAPVHVISGTDGTDPQPIKTSTTGSILTQPTGNVTAADDSALTNTQKTFSIVGIFDGTTVDMWYEITNGLNSTGMGIPAVGLSGQCDDTSPQALTENRWGALRVNCTDHALLIGGGAADDAAASGNPVPVACKYEATPNTVEDGDVSYLKCGPLGALYTLPGTNASAIVSTTITRPANTTTYTANTAWANATSSATYTTFANVCRRNAGQVLVPQIDIVVDEAPATKLQGILWLFNTIPTDPLEDNATFVLAAADWATLTGNAQGFPFTVTNNGPAAATFSGTSLTGTTYHADCASGATSIYAMVQVVNAYVPTSGEVMTLRLHTLAAN